jgi:aspartate kinase
VSAGAPTPLPVVVQKFGGTSVATPEGRAALRARVRQAQTDGSMPIIVVSAMGRAGAPYATDTLLGLLDGYVVEPREADLLSSCGEVVSAVVVAHELRAGGIPAVAMTGAEAGVLTDSHFGDAAVLRVEPAPLKAALNAGVVPVVTGFQGVTERGETTTLGRGGSDTSACAIAVALGAASVEIYTDVDGVMTADPRAFAGARVLDALQYEELFQMAKAGAKVMHAPAAEVARDAGVPLRVRNTYTDAPGTLVTDSARLATARGKRVVTAVSHTDDVARAIVALPSGKDRDRALTDLFRSMALAGVSLDMFTPLRDALALSFDRESVTPVLEVLERLGLECTVETDLATVTLVGAGMHGVPGVMARVAGALADAGVEILQVADSHYTISVLVNGSTSRRAIAALHDEFGLDA